MEPSRKLEIVQTRVVNFLSHYQWIFFCICVGLLPFLLIFMNTVHFHGEDTHRLQHDIKTAMLQPVPVPSMWVDYQQLKNGSTYVPVKLMWEGMFETFILLFPWNLQITVLSQLLSNSLISVIILHILLLKLSLQQYKKQRTVMFLLLVTLYSLLLCLAADGTLTMVYFSVRDNFLTWIDSNIVELYLDEHMDDITTNHPFTIGRYPPFFLTHHFRYLREDVVFECEYNVTSDLEIEPGYVTTWWRKNGVPVNVNDRMYVNVSIENVYNEIPFTKYSHLYLIRSTLTIEIIENSDYGLYTCDYVNNLPGRVRVKNYTPQNNSNYKTVQTPPPMTPDPKCGCQPTFHEEPERHALSVPTVCFSEFVLRPMVSTTKTVQIRPGGILVTAASYRTVANISDIKADVTFEGNSDRTGNSECCSLFIKIYWALFGKGSLVDLPISRLIGHHCENSTSKLQINKYSCICVDSFGIRDYSFYRDHFNTTIQKEEEIEIKHPVNLIIQPRDNGSIPMIGGFSFCLSSDLWLCQYVEALMDNSIYIFYTYDACIVFVIIIIVFFMILFVICSAVLVAKPLRKLCFPNCQYTLPFTAVQGPLVYVNSSISDGISCNFDIYLSYSEDAMYDREVARYVKALLTETDMVVFDSVEDILPGHLVAHESSEAITNSRCFVVITSKTYVNDNFKKMEFVTIQDSIISRGSEPKDCILIVQVEDCDIVGLHRVPCIRVPSGLKETFSLDQSSINRFYEWIVVSNNINITETTVLTQLYSSGFTLMSVIFISALVYLSAKSSIFTNTTQRSDETDVVNVA